MTSKQIARGLGWFGIGLGVLELLAPRAVARAAGVPGNAHTVRTFGLREITSGALILASEDPETMLWTRVAGDALDAGLLTDGVTGPHKFRAILATLLVAPIVAMDVYYASGSRNLLRNQKVRDITSLALRKLKETTAA